MNRRLLKSLGITEEDYKKWCQTYHKAAYKTSVKREFFIKIQKGQILRTKSGELVNKEKENV